MTKIAHGCVDIAELRDWLEALPDEARTATRYLPRRHEEMVGGSLFWIHAHAIIGRSPLIGFEKREDGRYWIRMEPRLIAVRPIPRRAHQGWRYLADTAAPPDLRDGEDIGDVLPGRLIGQLTKLGLV